VLLDDDDKIGDGSRAICFSKRSLEVWDRLGVAHRMVDKGVGWKTGKVFLGDAMVYQFDLQPEDGHKMPAFINLQQYYAETYLVDRVRELPAIDLRWRNKVTALEQHNDHAVLTVETPDGPYRLRAEYVVACDGARSALRGMVGADFTGEVFEDQFLIADVKVTEEFPPERRFWFDPLFHSGQSALLHRQPDSEWRIDLQLGPDADPVAERQPEKVRPRVERMLGHANFELGWVSVYKFQCRRMQRFLHERVIFAGDSAHQVSPFGARGANSGLEDGENLAWKLALILRGDAPSSLLASYEIERGAAADENIRASTRSTTGTPAAPGNSVTGEGGRFRQAHGEQRQTSDGLGIRHAVVDAGCGRLARGSAAGHAYGGCAAATRRGRADLSDRSVQIGRRWIRAAA
jgi:3-(3-hydroxy-phenyl)propionate hydroxylase